MATTTLTTHETDTDTKARPSNSHAAWPDTLAVAAWSGLVIGIIEAVIQLVQGMTGTFIGMDIQFLWMAPLAECLVYSVLAVPVIILIRRFPQVSPVVAVTGFLWFFGTLHCAKLIGGLHSWAQIIVSFAIAVQAARWAKSYAQHFRMLVGRTLPWSLLAVIAGAAVMTGYRVREESMAAQQLPPPPDESLPNLLFVVLDTVRADALGVYSDEAVATPNLEKLAASGITFENAISPASWTYPSHASMFTGVYANNLSADWFTPLGEEHPLLAEVLSRQGYDTGGFVANTMYCGRPTGLDRGFVRFRDYPLSFKQLMTHSRLFVNVRETHHGLSSLGLYDRPGRKTGQEITSEFTRWLDQRDESRPFFAFLNYMDAHDPYLPERLVQRDRALTHREKVLMKNWRWVVPSRTGEDLRQLAQDSYRSTLYDLDRQIGKLLDELSQRGIRENTIVIITSDHGELFGEHGVCGHGNNLYRPVVHVPLIISLPGDTESKRVNTPVTLRDLAATVLDLTQVDQHERLPGHSLRVTWQPSSTPEDDLISVPFASSSKHPAVSSWAVFTESPSIHGVLYSLLQEGSYLIRQGDGQRMLFDFLRDPAESTDLAVGGEFAERVSRLDESLETLLNPDSKPDDGTQHVHQAD